MTDKTPSEYFNLPVIGRIKAKLEGSVSGQSFSSTDEFDVIKIVEKEGEKIYMCNQWNAPGVVQLVPGVLVISFEEK